MEKKWIFWAHFVFENDCFRLFSRILSNFAFFVPILVLKTSCFRLFLEFGKFLLSLGLFCFWWRFIFRFFSRIWRNLNYLGFSKTIYFPCFSLEFAFWESGIRKVFLILEFLGEYSAHVYTTYGNKCEFRKLILTF